MHAVIVAQAAAARADATRWESQTKVLQAEVSGLDARLRDLTGPPTPREVSAAPLVKAKSQSKRRI